jgi:ABC-type nitrate/sulfonate/bicarbonate transport system ATPase subunit
VLSVELDRRQQRTRVPTPGDMCIHVAGLGVKYGDFVALRDVSLDIRDGEFVCLIGPSGCGKTTLLNVVAGFVAPSEGVLQVHGKSVAGPGADRGMVFQEYGLFPWFTVRENVEYGPRLKGTRKNELRRLADHYLGMVQLGDFGERYPNQLSGGMRQRVALARALANQPSILLLDEPFGALDAMTRDLLQDELVKIWETERRTCVFVTHSIAEAVYLADRIVVMGARPGHIRETIVNSIPRPRDRASEEFFAMYRVADRILRSVISQAALNPVRE